MNGAEAHSRVMKTTSLRGAQKDGFDVYPFSGLSLPPVGGHNDAGCFDCGVDIGCGWCSRSLSRAGLSRREAHVEGGLETFFPSGSCLAAESYVWLRSV